RSAQDLVEPGALQGGRTRGEHDLCRAWGQVVVEQRCRSRAGQAAAAQGEEQRRLVQTEGLSRDRVAHRGRELEELGPWSLSPPRQVVIEGGELVAPVDDPVGDGGSDPTPTPE